MSLSQTSIDQLLQPEKDVSEEEAFEDLNLEDIIDDQPGEDEPQPEPVTDGQHQQQEADDDFDLLEGHLEVEQMKEERKQELREMNQALDLKLARMREGKQQQREQQMIKEAEEMREGFSGILLKKGTRLVKQEELEIAMKGKSYVPLEQIDTLVDLTGQQSTRHYFTVGVVVENSRPLESKGGKQFSVMLVSDLYKYEMFKVKKMLEKREKQELAKIEEKSFLNGYKTMKILIFNELSDKISQIPVGTVICLVNVKSMKPTAGKQNSFCLDLEKQVLKVGFSEHFYFCKGTVNQKGSTIAGFFGKTCSTFLNRSVESLCEKHKIQSQEFFMQKIKSNRLGLSDNIDINKVKRQYKEMMAEQKVGAFGGARRLEQQKRPLSPKSQAKLAQYQEKEREQYEKFIKERKEKSSNVRKHHFLSTIKCNERDHLQGIDFKAKARERAAAEEELEIERGSGEKQEKPESLRELIMRKKKMTFREKFGEEQVDADEVKKRKVE